MKANKKKQGRSYLSILAKINWFKLTLLLLFVGAVYFTYFKYEQQINWFLVQRPEEKRIQKQYHLYGRHPIVDPAKGAVFISTGVYDRTEASIQQFIEKARNRRKSQSKAAAAMPNLLYFSGPSGIGKSSSLVRIANQYVKKRGWYVFYYDLSKLFQNFKLRDCLNVINSATSNHKDSESMRSKAMYSDMPIQIQKQKFSKYIQSLLVLLENDKEVLIIFDGFQIFDEQPEIKILMQQFMKIVKKGGYLIAAGLNTEVLDHLGSQLKSARKNLWQIQQHQKVSEKQIRRYTKGNYPNLRKPEIQRLVNLADTFIEIRSIIKLTPSEIQKLKRTKATQMRKIMATYPSTLQDLCQLCMQGSISQGKSTRILLKNNIAQDLESWETRITRMVFQENFIDQCPQKAKKIKQCYDHRDYQVKQYKLQFQDINTEGQEKLVTNRVESINKDQNEEDELNAQNQIEQQIKQQKVEANVAQNANKQSKLSQKDKSTKKGNQVNDKKAPAEAIDKQDNQIRKQINEQEATKTQLKEVSKTVNTKVNIKIKQTTKKAPTIKQVGPPPGKMKRQNMDKIKQGLKNQEISRKKQESELKARNEAKKAQSLNLKQQKQRKILAQANKLQKILLDAKVNAQQQKSELSKHNKQINVEQERIKTEQAARIQQLRLQKEKEKRQAQQAQKIQKEKQDAELKAQREQLQKAQKQRKQQAEKKQIEQREKAAKQQRQRSEKLRIEQQRKKTERLRVQRQQRERLEKQKRDLAEKEKAQRIEKQKREAAEKLERQRLEKQKRDLAQKEKKQRIQRERIEKQKREAAEKLKAEKIQRERIEKQKRDLAEKEKAEKQERENRQREQKENQQREKIAKQQAERVQRQIQQRAKLQRQQKERIAKQQAERIQRQQKERAAIQAKKVLQQSQTHSPSNQQQRRTANTQSTNENTNSEQKKQSEKQHNDVKVQ